MNTNVTVESNNITFPNWLEDLFILYLANYDKMWADTIEDDRAKYLKKILWLDALKKFNPQTILRAGKEVMLRCPTYPPRVGEVHKLCEEFSRQTSTLPSAIDSIHAYKRNSAPSEYLIEYMKENHIPSVMPIEDARKWFYAVKDSLSLKKRDHQNE